jgi:polyisoprenyl-teichoic acid--peptidoglycan teichoic acid transferase
MRGVRRVLITACVLVVAVALSATALSAAWLAGYRLPGASGATYLRVVKLSPGGHASRPGGPNAPFFVLLVGNDSRPGVGGARGDALHLVGINPKLHKATMLDIPRDTCWDGDKINAANAEGGPVKQAAAVGGLVGVPVGYAVDVDFAGFTALVDGVGGLNMQVPTAMHDTYSGAYFAAGPQHMNGGAALAFSRDRHDFPQSDIIRTANQGLLILAAIKQLQHKMDSASGQFHLITLLYSQLYQHAQLDNLGIADLYHLGRILEQIPVSQIRSVTIPTIGGQCLTLAGNAAPLFADFRDDAVLEHN